MRKQKWVLGFVALSGASLVLAGCSGGGEGAEDAAEKVTVASLMGVPSDDDFDFNSTVEHIEEAVADCMANEGWNYIPRKIPTIQSAISDGDEEEIERIKVEGLGFTYYLLNDSSGGEQSNDPSTSFVDHNESYVQTLSESERKAYDASLYGTEEEQAADTTTFIDPSTGEETTVTLGSAGCRGEARDGFYGDDPAHNPAYTEAMQAYWDELATRTDADPRFITLDAEWSTCMKEAGYDYQSPEQYSDSVYFEIQTRTDEVVGPEFYADPMEGWTQEAMDEFWASATEDEIAALYSSPTELTAAQRTQLEAIFADEVDIALAAHECSQDYDEAAREISADVEEQYALEHEDELKALAAAIFDGE